MKLNAAAAIWTLILTAGVIAHLPAQIEMSSSASRGVPNAGDNDRLRLDFSDGIYRLEKAIQVFPLSYVVNGRSTTAYGDPLGFKLEKGEPVAIEDLNNGTLRMHIALIGDEARYLPSELIIPANQLPGRTAKHLSRQPNRDLHLFYEHFINKKKDKKAHIIGHRWGHGADVRYIHQTERISTPLGSGATVAFNLRDKYGYRSGSCKHPVVGTIASWTGHKYGYTAKWDGSCWRTDNPLACSFKNGMPGAGYRFNECVIK